VWLPATSALSTAWRLFFSQGYQQRQENPPKGITSYGSLLTWKTSHRRGVLGEMYFAVVGSPAQGIDELGVEAGWRGRKEEAEGRKNNRRILQIGALGQRMELDYIWVFFEIFPWQQEMVGRLRKDLQNQQSMGGNGC
jgi:hypothetical protein